ncbi:hypothetical protein [Bdellovibrio bacteriovorus]|uniref:hypothetical protein n=1 Tax=Bdellovibrio bacteriovorus TaxID=959 RepID=UPI003D082961
MTMEEKVNSVIANLKVFLKLPLQIGLGVLAAFFFVYEIYGAVTLRVSDLSSKDDFKIREEILGANPGFDVSILTSDLVGLGEKYFIAYGNEEYVKRLYQEQVRNGHWGESESKYNRPFIKIYTANPEGVFEILLAKVGISLPKSLKNRLVLVYEFSPVVYLDDGDLEPKMYLDKYIGSFSGKNIFMVEGVKVVDLDADGAQEIVIDWITFNGGVSGARYSTILHVVDDEFRLVPGHPEFLDVDKSKTMWGFMKASGWTNPRLKVVPNLEIRRFEDYVDLLGLESDDIRGIKSAKNQSDINVYLKKFFTESWEQHKKPKSILIDPKSGNKVVMTGLSLEDFGRWYQVDDVHVFTVAFAVEDDNPFWLEHDWRFMAFRFKSGRWISDRVINGDEFLGVWLSDRSGLTFNDVFGTYPDQCDDGLAWTFVNPDWAFSSFTGQSDPYGVEMRMKSPVEIKLRKMYSDYVYRFL